MTRQGYVNAQYVSTEAPAGAATADAAATDHSPVVRYFTKKAELQIRSSAFFMFTK